jgi:ubiquinone/menaquinone biosynthesis C-methylase UbiE
MSIFREPMRLLPKEDLVNTGPIDQAAQAYSFALGWLHMAKMRLGVDLLPNRVNKLLEIGYGGGILMPELDTHTNQLYGIDPHLMKYEVGERLRVHGVHARLASGAVEALPYENAYFDRVIAIGGLDWVADLDAACREIARVLVPEGRFVLVMPGQSKLVEWGFKLFTGKQSPADHQRQRERVLPTLMQYFEVVRSVNYPPVLGNALSLFQAFDLEPKSSPLTNRPHFNERTRVTV